MGIPSWVQGACIRAKSTDIEERVKKKWNDLVDDFLNIRFVRKFDKPWRLDVVDQLELGLSISKHVSLKDIANIPIKKLYKTGNDYVNKAYNEEQMKRNEARFVVYGHTHAYSIQPLDLVPMTSDNLEKIYFNSGTWRKVHVKTAFDLEHHEFLNWYVMTFIAFYLTNERKNRKFEVWNGALG